MDKLATYQHVRVMFEEADLGIAEDQRIWIVALLRAVEDGEDLRTAIQKANA